MGVAGKDENGVNTMICLSDADSITILPVFANPTNHGLKIDDDTTGSFTTNHALKDANAVSTLCALSSSGDGAIVPLYVKSSTNGLRINSH